MQKVDIYAECPQCGDSQQTEYYGLTSFVCCECCIAWEQVEHHPNYTCTRHPYFWDWYYTHNVRAIDHECSEHNRRPSDSYTAD